MPVVIAFRCVVILLRSQSWNQCLVQSAIRGTGIGREAPPRIDFPPLASPCLFTLRFVQSRLISASLFSHRRFSPRIFSPLLFWTFYKGNQRWAFYEHTRILQSGLA